MLFLFVFIGCFSSLCFRNASGAQHRVRANFLVMVSQTGDFAYFSQLKPMLELWQSHLTNKSRLDSSWPLDATVEFVDARSSVEFCQSYLTKRLQNKTAPNITAMVGAESYLGLNIAEFVSNYNIPVLEIESYVNTNVLNAFYVIPKVSDKANALVDLYLENHVETLVAVAVNHASDAYDRRLCFEAADLAQSRGIHTWQLEISPQYKQSDIEQMIQRIKSEYNPDVILWCDFEICYYDDKAKRRNPLIAFQKVNYLPKALSMTDCIGFGVQSEESWAELFQYVSSGMFSHPKMRGGLAYTEDATPYSSHFRPANSFNLTVRFENCPYLMHGVYLPPPRCLTRDAHFHSNWRTLSYLHLTVGCCCVDRPTDHLSRRWKS